MKPVEDAFDTLEKTREKVSEAKQVVERLQTSPNTTDQEIYDITLTYQRIAMQIKREHSDLFLRTLESIIACLRSLRQHQEGLQASASLFEDIKRKAQATQLEKLLGRSHKETYSKFEHALKRVLHSENN